MEESHDLAGYRAELTGFCYRMLGCFSDAEDAVQETMERAWRRSAQYDQTRASHRTWVYAIARNVCIDVLRTRQRRTRPSWAGDPAALGDSLGEPFPQRWVTSAPDACVINTEADPASIVARRESIRLAFVAALQVLPSRQRCALILKDVLAWESNEIAQVLEASASAVNSALQRARKTLAELDLAETDILNLNDTRQASLVERFVRAFEDNDVDALVALMREDAAMTMPPFAWWLRGRDTIRAAMSASDACRGSRLITTAANGSPAFAQYQRLGEDGDWQPRSVMVLELRDGLIQELTIFLGPGRMFAALGLPITAAEIQSRLCDEPARRPTYTLMHPLS